MDPTQTFLQDYDSLDEKEKEEYYRKLQRSAALYIAFIFLVDIAGALFIPRLSRKLLLVLEKKLMAKAT